MPSASVNKRPTDPGMAIQMPPHDVAVSGPPMKPAALSKRRRFLFSSFVLSLLGTFFLAMYINVLNSFPEFVDEAGNSTIDVSVM